MYKNVWPIFLFILLSLILSGCYSQPLETNKVTDEQPVVKKEPTIEEIRQKLMNKYGGMIPLEWGERVQGV